MQFTENPYTSDKLNLALGKRQVESLFQLVAHKDIMETLIEHSV